MSDIRPFSPLPAGIATTRVAASVASASGNLTDSVTRGAPGSSIQLQVANQTASWAYFRVTVGAGTAVNTDTPVAPGSVAIYTINPNATVFSCILDSGTGTVIAQLGDGN